MVTGCACVHWHRPFDGIDHIRGDFYELLLLEIQKLIFSPTKSITPLFPSLTFCCIYLLSITAVQFSGRGGGVRGERSGDHLHLFPLMVMSSADILSASRQISRALP